METTKFLGKSILKNKILIISIIVLLSSILFLYNYLFLGVLDVNNNYESMKDKSDVSDCQYIPELELSDDEILDIVKEYEIPLSEIEDDDVIEKYNVNLDSYYEKRLDDIKDKYNFEYDDFRYKVLNYKGMTYFFTCYDGKINRFIFSDDKELKSGEVFVTNSKDDYLLELKDKGYCIVGDCSSIDFIQLYDVKKSQSNLAMDNVGVYMDKKDYDEIDADEIHYYNLKFSTQNDYDDFIDKYEDDAIHFRDTEKYLANFEDVIAMNFRLSYIAIIAYLFVSIVIFYITYKNLLDSLDKELGLLKIIGVRTRSIMLSVMGIYMCILLVSGIVGNALGLITQNAIREQFKPLYNFVYLENYAFVKERVAFTFVLLVLILIIVTVMLRLKLANHILVLLKSESLSKNSILLRKIKPVMSKLPLTCQVKTAFALRKVSRIMIIFIGAFICTNFLAIGIGLYNKQLSEVNELNELTEFNNAYYFDEIKYSENKNVAYIEETKLVTADEKQTVQVVSLNKEGNVFAKDIYENLEADEILIPKNIAIKNDLKKGDKVKITINDKQLEYKIGKILNGNYEHRCYVDLKALYKNCLKNKSYNVFYQKANEDSLKQKILDDAIRVEKQEDYRQNNINSFSQILMIVGVLLVFSLLAVIIVFSLISSLNIHDSMSDIKIMRFLGYGKVKIQMLTITTYLAVIVITMVAGYFAFPQLCNKFESLVNVSNWDFYLGIDNSVGIYITSGIIVLINYYFWMLLVYYTKVKNYDRGNKNTK